ncbi:annexin domain-containing protein [Hirsutella rhossiliensis]|uniref:Annexin domain-containing protein n=1 Tax=Hirsutella rhossiliensis TaxID=111463 RepID=A0A9P8MZE2_9HYPO|nr:annexin domain-containing protein [Hirsutella rhossiliensis]KAH0964065.1 annexin domain-containing protein [Hirsutella rhossiliensis]
MSLLVEDNRRGGRSRSRSRTRDQRPHEELQTYADVREPSYVYPEDHLDSVYKPSRRQDAAGGLPYPAEGGMDGMLPGRQSLYNYDDDDRPVYRNASPPQHESSYRSSKSKLDSHLPRSFPDDDKERRRSSRYGDEEPRVRQTEPPKDSKNGRGDLSDELLKFLPQKYGRKYGDGGDRDRKGERRAKKERDEEDLAYGPPPTSQPPRSPRPDESPLPYGGYAAPGPPRQSENRSSQYGRDEGGDRRRHGLSDDGYGTKKSSHRDSYRQEPSGSSANVLTVEPSGRERDRRRDRSPGPSNLAVEPDRRDRDRSRDRRGGETRDRSPKPPTARMSSLTVDTGRSSNLSLAAAPGSPLLESYHGTYQNCSPMPSPLLLASQGHGDDARVIDALSPLNSDAEGDAKKTSRRARFHDGEDIASSIAQALRGDRPPHTQPLVEILPSLSHDQVMELRAEYKRLVKTGSERKGVNVAKHIRARLKDEDPNLMKACYAVALGKWESEAYWANFWYQGDKTRRELLIESLMGRTNAEIRSIKDAFTDKKYDNSLTRCMKTELKEDKFKKAVLMVLDERRMEDLDSHGRRVPLDYDLVDHDVDDLRRAVKAEKGGESAMIAIVVKRSDAHLRAVLKEYEHHYRANFAREALKKSGNLVGELLAHILNGVINRPVRDALLLHHALSASRKDDLRRELLISRLVRFHWEPAHMQAVKRAFRERYGGDLQDAVREATSGLWGRFCCELCIARMPNDVRRVERR